MILENIIEQVNSVYREIDNNNKQLIEKTGLNCIAGCGKCCNNQEIEETVLGMLPGAVYLFNNGKAEEYLEKLEAKFDDNFCIFYKFEETNKNRGFCLEYEARGLICRLFGFAGIKDKNDKVVFTPCEPIRETDYELKNKLTNCDEISIMQHYGYKLISIDPYMGTKRYHINEALRIALEKVLLINSMKN